MASAGNGRRPQPRFFSNRLRFCPAARIKASQLTCQSLGGLVGADAIEAGLIDTAADGASLFAGGTLRFERAGIAVFGPRPIATRALGGMRLIKAQFFACGADIEVALRLVAKALDAKERRAMINVGRGNIRPNALAFDGDQIVFRAAFLVASHLPRPQLPAKPRPPEQVKHGLIVHHFRRRDQHLENDARFAPIDDVVRVVA